MATPRAGRLSLERTQVRAGWRAVTLVGCALVLALILGLGLAATCRPAWYRPASIDRTRLRADKAALATLQDEISAALNSGREIRLQLHEDQVNRWLAARAEIWPETATELGALEQPHVSLIDGVIRVGVTATKGDFRAVIGLTCRVDVTEDNVVLRHEATRLGAIPVPRSWVSDLMTRLPSAGHLGLDANRRGMIVLKNDWIWPNGKRRCRLRELRVSSGVVDVVLEPYPGGKR